MSLATRCTNCSTVFRVVQDQLLVSEGWVRCGRCREVFNAIENMFDLKKDVASAQVPLGADASPSVPPNIAQPTSARPFDDSMGYIKATTRESLGQNHEQPVRTSLWPVDDTPSVPSRHRFGKTSALEQDDDFQMSALTLDVPAGDAGLPSGHQVDELLVSNSRDTTFEPSEPVPEFIERAHTESQWRHPRVRLALRVSAVLLSLTLLLQWALHSRDYLAASSPAAEAMLQALCAPLRCRLQPPRLLEALKVESTTFGETATAGVFRLGVVLRNQGAVRARMPALDVKLMNARGDVLTRRVITSQELGVSASAIEPQAEIVLQGQLRVTQGAVHGYDVTAFYP